MPWWPLESLFGKTIAFSVRVKQASTRIMCVHLTHKTCHLFRKERDGDFLPSLCSFADRRE